MTSFHAYLSNRLKTPDEKLVTVVAWNKINGLIACGTKNGVITIQRVNYNPDHPGLCKIDIIMTLIDHKAEITALSWNERFNKLTSGDENGVIMVWIEREGKWVPNMVNDLGTHRITSLASTNNGELIAICYGDGRILCGDVSGNQKWTSHMHTQCSFVSWSPDNKKLYVGSKDSKILILKNRGNRHKELDIKSLEISDDGNEIRAVEWSASNPSLFLVAFQNGSVHLMQEDEDTAPINITMQLDITAAKWAQNGQYFAVAGNIEPGHCQLRFFTKEGKHIRTLNISAQTISSMSFNQTDSQLILGVDYSICLTQIVPINPWAYLKDTLIYSVRCNFTDDYDIVFFNSVSGERHIKRIKNLLGITASDEYVLLASVPEESTESSLLLCDQDGVPENDNFIPFQPNLFAATNKYVIAASNNKMTLWDHKANEIRNIRFKDDATAMAARNNTLFVAFSSGELVMYNLPECEEIAKYNLFSVIEQIEVCTDLTRLSLIDVYGNMTFLDVHSGAVAGQCRKETWCMKWASDSPSLFISLERQKLFVFRDFEVEEPIISLTHICSFTDLVIKAVDFIGLYRGPLNPTLDSFHTYESKSLRDLKNLLQSGPTQIVDEITNYVKSKNHPRLWLMLAESALEYMNLPMAERAFIECQNTAGIQFMKRLNSLPKNGQIQKGYALWYLKRYEEAEECFAGTDLAVQMYATAGIWSRVAELVNKDDEELYVRAHDSLGHEAYVAGEWAKAAQEFALSKNYERQLQSLYHANDFFGIKKMIEFLQPNDPILKDIGFKFVALGSHENAVAAFIKCGEIQTAVDACCHLNQWKTALQLAEEHPKIDKRVLMGRYAHHLASNNHITQAINMFVRFKLPKEAALILDKEGDIAFRQTRQYLQAKKCYVFASELMLQYAKSKGLTTCEESEAAWKKAEAVHFLLLAHQQLYQGMWEDALTTSARVFYVYSDLVGKDRAAALLALCGFSSRYLKQCSNGFIQLEHSEQLPRRKRERMERMAVRIFGKSPPIDPEPAEKFTCKKCKSQLTIVNPKCSCGYIIPASIVSGRPIIGTSIWKCQKCKHMALKSEIESCIVCPLCHTSVRK